MLVEATTASPLASEADTIAVGVFEGEEPPFDLPGGELSALIASGEARREFKRLAVTHAEGRRFLVVGLGQRGRFDAERARVAAAVAHARAREIAAQTLCWEVPSGTGAEVVAALVQGTLLGGYRFDRYNSRPDDARTVRRLLISASGEDLSAAVGRARLLSEAQNRARDLGNTPANDLPPAALAAYAQEVAGRHGIAAEVLDEPAIRALGMGAFAAVAQGSEQEARLIRLDYEGAGAPDGSRLGLVGKAVTFDSGGLSLKSASSMEDMKFDMCGGAAVVEAVGAMAELGLPIRVTALIGATENLPSGAATKPGDIVRALDGTTIEINNTDAEGRLVLADCISYARQIGCERIIDLATLTGGVLVALGSVYAGLMSNDDGWAEAVLAAAQVAGEPAWRLPLHPEYADLMKGRYGKLSNRAEKREASTITGAEFLHHFAGEVPWVHLDIAGTAYDVRRPYFDRGATGYGVRLLVELAQALSGVTP